jgi:hypothetical protein
VFLLERGDTVAGRRALEAALKDAQRGHDHSREHEPDLDRAGHERAEAAGSGQ